MSEPCAVMYSGVKAGEYTVQYLSVECSKSVQW